MSTCNAGGREREEQIAAVKSDTSVHPRPANRLIHDHRVADLSLLSLIGLWESYVSLEGLCREPALRNLMARHISVKCLISYFR